MIRDVAAAAGVALAAAATLRADVNAGKHRWNPDSYDYALRMLLRCGVPLERATEDARAFFTRVSWLANDPRYAHAYVGLPPWWTLFAPRVVYPALSALLYRRRGYAALTDVAAASSIASAVALYRFLRRFGGRGTALTLTLWYVRRDHVRDVAVHAMSDSTAMLLWIGVLDAMAELADGGAAWLRLSALSVALSFTRPLPYLPLGAGAALALSGAVARDGARARTGSGIAAIALGCAVAVTAVLVRAGVPSTRAHLEGLRETQRGELDGGKYDRIVDWCGLGDHPSHSLLRWYATTVGLSVATSTAHALIAVVPVLALGGLTDRKRADVPLLVGAVLGGVLGGCAADPAPRSTARTIVLPLYPVFAAGAALAITRFFRRGRG